MAMASRTRLPGGGGLPPGRDDGAVGGGVPEGAQVVGLPPLLRPHLHRGRHVGGRGQSLRRPLLPQGHGRLHAGESPSFTVTFTVTFHALDQKL